MALELVFGFAVKRLCSLQTLGWDAEEEELEPVPAVDVLVVPAAEAVTDASPETVVPDASPPAKAATGGPGKV